MRVTEQDSENSMSIQLRLLAIFCLIGTLLQTASALSVTQPSAATVVTAGGEFATQVIGDPWDMSNAQDVVTVESYAVSSQTFSAGIYSGNTTANGANFYPLFMGYPSSINLSRGAYFPIETARYRYLTLRIRATQPAGTMQFVRAVFLQNDSSSYGDNTLGYSSYFSLPANQWTTIRIDLDTQLDPGSPHQWTAFPKVMGLRIDPATLEPLLAPKAMWENRLPGIREAKLWAQFSERYAEIVRDIEGEFGSMFGRALLDAYERQLDAPSISLPRHRKTLP